MKELLAMQWRFNERHGIRAARLLQHKRFRAAYDSCMLRARCGEVEQEAVGLVDRDSSSCRPKSSRR